MSRQKDTKKNTASGNTGAHILSARAFMRQAMERHRQAQKRNDRIVKRRGDSKPSFYMSAVSKKVKLSTPVRRCR